MKAAFISLFLLMAVTFTLAQESPTLPFPPAQQPAAGPPQLSISSAMGLHTSPAKNQTPEQQQQDEMACYSSVKQESGFDPMAALMAQRQPPAPFAPPPMLSQMQNQAPQQQQQQTGQQSQPKSEMQQKLDGFKKGFSACMESKNYVVK